MSEWQSTDVGEIPAEWHLVRLSDLASQIVDGTHFTPTYLDSGIPFLRVTDIQTTQIELEQVKRISEKEHRILNQRCNPSCGDILLSKNGTVGIPMLVNWDWPFSIFVSLCLIKLKPTALSTFMRVVLESPIIAQQIHRRSKQGTVTNLHLEEIRDFQIPLPPLPQQRKIARILTTLDNVIIQTEALIAKYQAIKQGLMHDLFTRGVDATGKLRPPQSEAPELYKSLENRFIPASWHIASLSDFADVSGGVTLGREISGTGVVSLPYLRVANVQDGYVDLSEIKNVEILKSEIDRYALCPGDVLMTEGGDFDKLGRGTVWKGQISPCLHQNHVFRVRPVSVDLNSDYLSHLTASAYGRNYFLMCAKQTTNLASINATQVKAFPLILPSPEEQLAIVGHIAAIDNMLSVERSRIHKARSTKTGLMQDLLTGKVSVNVEVRMQNEETGGISGRKNAE